MSRQLPTECAHGAIMAERKAETLNAARHHGDPWTGPELELVASRPELTVTQLALMLGRTYAATVQARYLVDRDPRKTSLAGIPLHRP